MPEGENFFGDPGSGLFSPKILRKVGRRKSKGKKVHAILPLRTRKGIRVQFAGVTFCIFLPAVYLTREAKF
jgi:hypothetical protein